MRHLPGVNVQVVAVLQPCGGVVVQFEAPCCTTCTSPAGCFVVEVVALPSGTMLGRFMRQSLIYPIQVELPPTNFHTVPVSGAHQLI